MRMKKLKGRKNKIPKSYKERKAEKKKLQEIKKRKMRS